MPLHRDRGTRSKRPSRFSMRPVVTTEPTALSFQPDTAFQSQPDMERHGRCQVQHWNADSMEIHDVSDPCGLAASCATLPEQWLRMTATEPR